MSVTYVPAALRRLVHERARRRCEYCATPESIAFLPHQIDHVIAEKHGGLTVEDNLCLACVICNQRKGTDLATIHTQSQELVPLFNPRRDEWPAHFRFREGVIEGLTPVGVATAHFLSFNTPERINERLLFIDDEFLAEMTRPKLL